jgi:uroporphyrinogen III methyltransferase/synthase
MERSQMNKLEGKRIIVTRSRKQAGCLIRALEKQHAEVLAIPVIEIQDPTDPAPLEQAAAHAGDYDLVIFTSANGVAHFVKRHPAKIRGAICAIGPGTATALRRHGMRPKFIPKRYIAEGLLEALADFPLQGARVLIPRAAVARDVIPVELTRLGAKVDVVEAYRTVLPADSVEQSRKITAKSADLVTFTSSSTVDNFGKLFSGKLPRIPAACIGPITSATARKNGWRVAVEAEEYTIQGLVKAIVAYCSAK